MKRLMLTLALMGGFTALAQEAAPAPAAQPPATMKREAHARPMRRGFDRRPPMMGMMHGRVRSFGKLADGRETKVYRLQGMGGLILDISDYGGRLVRCYAPDRFGMLLASGITAMIAIQVMLNIAVVTSSMPATGVTLPFISYGGNALWIFMFSMGVLLNISRHRRRTDIPKEEIRTR